MARALHALEAAGFLLRQRRFKRVEEAGGEPEAPASGGPCRGPRYAQTSNAYRPLLPGRILGLLPRWLRPAPIPVDALQHAQARDEEVAAMHATLSCRELAQATVGGALGRVLASLGARIDSIACESQNHPQPLLDSYVMGSSGVGLNGQQRN